MNTKTLSLLALSLVTLLARAASAETVVRKVVRVDELPYGGSPTKLTPAQVHLPSGVKNGGAVPAAWKNFPGSDSRIVPSSYCFEGRTSFVSGYDEHLTTDKLVTIEGKEYLDRASVSTKDDKVAVEEATRIPVLKILDAGSNVAVWGYRQRVEGEGAQVVLLAGIDYGESTRGGIFFGCRLAETYARLPTNAVTIRSSPNDTNGILRSVWENYDEKKGKLGFWTGEQYRVEASTSKSAADPAPMLALFVKR